MGKFSSTKFCFLLLSVIYLCSLDAFARRSGGGGGGGGIRSSSGGSFGRSAGSSRFGGSSGGYRSTGWGSSGGGGFGGSSRTASATRYSSPSGGGAFGGGSATRYGSSGISGSSGRYGTVSGSSGAGATRYGSSSGAVGGGSSATRYGSSGASATRYGSASSSSGRIGGTGTGAVGGTIGSTRYGGGSYSGAGSSAGRVAAAPTLTRYGSQQSSTGGIFGSSGGAGSSSTRWGSSAASGTARAGTPLDSMRTRFAGSGAAAGSVRSPTYSAGNARPNYGFGSSNTMSRARPQVQAPAPVRSQPTKVVYSTTYNNYHNSGSRYGTSGFGGGSSFLGGGSRSGFGTGSLVATGLAAGVGGYALGRMMGSLSRPYGYSGYGGYGYGGGYGYPGYGGMGYGGMGGCGMYGCSPYTSYVPYRDRYQEYYPTPAPQPAVDQYNPNVNQGSGVSGGGVAPSVPVQTSTEAPKNIDLCMLARWNRELAFAEMPNMALDFLINNNVSGNTVGDKAKFMHDFLTVSVDAYDQYNSSADIFAIPPTFDMKTCNIKVSKNSLVNSANAVQAEEPILTSIRHMLSLYSNKSANTDDLQDVVDAAKACLPQGPTVTSPEVLGCIDFSLSPEQMLKLDVPHSMFGSSEICRRQLSPDMFKCVPKAAGSPCKLEHLANLNLFARNFYLCSEAIDDSTMKQIESSNSNQAAPSLSATTRYPVIPITTAKPSFWSRIFG